VIQRPYKRLRVGSLSGEDQAIIHRWAGSQILPSLDLFRPTGLAICMHGVGASAILSGEERSLKNQPAPVV
jgi:hypothetical protein